MGPTCSFFLSLVSKFFRLDYLIFWQVAKLLAGFYEIFRQAPWLLARFWTFLVHSNFSVANRPHKTESSGKQKVGVRGWGGREDQRGEGQAARNPSTVGSGRCSLLCETSLTRSPPPYSARLRHPSFEGWPRSDSPLGATLIIFSYQLLYPTVG